MAVAGHSVENDKFVVSLQERRPDNFFNVFYDASPEFLSSLLNSILDSTCNVDGFFSPERIRRAAQDSASQCLQKSWPGIFGLVIFYGEKSAAEYLEYAGVMALLLDEHDPNWFENEFKKNIIALTLKPMIEVKIRNADDGGVKKKLTLVARKHNIKICFTVEKKKTDETSLLALSAERLITSMKTFREIEELEIPASLKEGILREKWGEKLWLSDARERKFSRLSKLCKFFCFS